MHVAPVEPDTQHYDPMSVATRELADAMQPHLKFGTSLALIIDWKTQERKLQFYQTNRHGQTIRPLVMDLPSSFELKPMFQDVLREAVALGCANLEPRS